jgi:RNA polymerase sigma-70 factor (ECF subfamily)
MSVITADYPRNAFIDSDHVPFTPPREGDRWRADVVAIPARSRRPSFECPLHRDPRHESTPDRPSCTWEDQFTEVVNTRLPRLQRLARRILRSEDLADDAVQEALLSLWKEGRMPPNPEGWLVNAVVLRSLHLNRSRRRRRDYEERAGARRPEHDPCGDPSRLQEAREFAHTIEAALKGLPEHLRTVFVLREAEQRDYESIAEVLGVPVGTVRSRLHRAREALKDGLRTLTLV